MICYNTNHRQSLIPAQAGIHLLDPEWIPAFAGATVIKVKVKSEFV